MVRRTMLLVLVAGSIGGLAAGCGSSSTPSGGGSAGTTGTSASTGTGGTSGSSNPNATAAVQACKARINAATTLPAGERAKLTKVCDDAASGNAADAKKVIEKVCADIVKSKLPSGTPSAIRNQALAACKKA